MSTSRSHRVNFRLHPRSRYYACAVCGVTCPTVRDRQTHADLMEGRTTDTSEDES